MSKLKSGILKKKGVLIGIITGGVVVGLVILGSGIVWYKNYNKERRIRRIQQEETRGIYEYNNDEYFGPFMKFIEENEKVTFQRILEDSEIYTHFTGTCTYSIKIIDKKILEFKQRGFKDVMFYKMNLKKKNNYISYNSKKYYIYINYEHITITDKQE